MSSIWNRRAKQGANGADPASLAEVARKLRPRQGQSEEHRAAVLERLKRMMNPVEQREDAGTRDGLEESPTGVHEVTHPDLGTIRMSDIEPMDPARMARVAEQLAQVLDHADWEGRSK